MSDNTQSPQVPVDGTPAQQPPTNPNQGVQDRINELTATIHAQKEQTAQALQMQQELMAQNARLQEELLRRAQPQDTLPPLPEGTDPSLVDAISARVQAPLMATIQKLERTLQQTVGGVSANQEQMAMQAALAGQPEAVQRDAMSLYHEAKKNGLQGWTPQNLVWMARGRVGVPQTRATAPDMPGGAGVPSLTQAPSVKRKSEAEIAAMSRDDRVKYYESLVGDAEIVY